jgi:hypothetical protein
MCPPCEFVRPANGDTNRYSFDYLHKIYQKPLKNGVLSVFNPTAVAVALRFLAVDFRAVAVGLRAVAVNLRAVAVDLRVLAPDLWT